MMRKVNYIVLTSYEIL